MIFNETDPSLQVVLDSSPKGSPGDVMGQLRREEESDETPPASGSESQLAEAVQAEPKDLKESKVEAMEIPALIEREDLPYTPHNTPISLNIVEQTHVEEEDHCSDGNANEPRKDMVGAEPSEESPFTLLTGDGTEGAPTAAQTNPLNLKRLGLVSAAITLTFSLLLILYGAMTKESSYDNPPFPIANYTKKSDKLKYPMDKEITYANDTDRKTWRHRLHTIFEQLEEDTLRSLDEI